VIHQMRYAQYGPNGLKEMYAKVKQSVVMENASRQVLTRACRKREDAVGFDRSLRSESFSIL
jgi:hypothetical protein